MTPEPQFARARGLLTELEATIIELVQTKDTWAHVDHEARTALAEIKARLRGLADRCGR